MVEGIETRKVGTIKVQVSQFIINDNNVSNIIQGALVRGGLDIEIKPIFNDVNQFIGEEFKVFSIRG